MFEPGLLPAQCLLILQNPADALFGQMVSPAQRSNACACGIVISDTVIADLQFRFVVRFLSPFMPGARLPGNVDVYAVGILLNLANQFLRQDFSAFI